MMIRSRTVVSAPKPSFQRRSIGFTKVHGKTTKRVQASSRIPVASRATALKPTKNGAPKEVSRRTVVQATTKEPVDGTIYPNPPKMDELEISYMNLFTELMDKKQKDTVRKIEKSMAAREAVVTKAFAKARQIQSNPEIPEAEKDAQFKTIADFLHKVSPVDENLFKVEFRIGYKVSMTDQQKQISDILESNKSDEEKVAEITQILEEKQARSVMDLIKSDPSIAEAVPEEKEEIAKQFPHLVS